MPILRHRVNDGVPYIVTRFKDDDENAVRFATWYPNQTAINQFNASQILDGNEVPWNLFHKLRADGHIVPGDEGGGIGLPSGQIQEIQTTQNQIRVYFHYISVEQSPDYENLVQIFKGCLFEIRKYESYDTQNTLYLTVAEEIRDLISKEDPSSQQIRFLLCIRNTLIANIPARIERTIKTLFRVSDEDWDNLRNQRPLGLPLNNGIEVQNVERPQAPAPILDLETRSGSLESLSELLTFAFLKRFQGKNVEIEVRVKNP